MKDIVITAKRLKKEVLLFTICFIIGIMLNIISIAIYKTQWKELITQLHVVLLVAIVLYILIVLIRIIVFAIKQILKKRR